MCTSDTYVESIPEDGPPSWNGRLVRYSYKLTVGAQRLSGTVQMLRIPFTVLKLPGKGKDLQSRLYFVPFRIVEAVTDCSVPTKYEPILHCG